MLRLRALQRPMSNMLSQLRLLSSYPPHTVFPMPALSPTMEIGNIADWKIEEGQAFSAGDVLCEVETDKATVDFEAQDDGVLAKILKGGGSKDIPVGTPLCVVVEEENEVSAFANFTVDDGKPESSQAVASLPEVSADEVVSASDIVLMPSARHIIQSQNLDISTIQGTGKGGRITKGDVLNGIKNGTVGKSALVPQAATETQSTAKIAQAAASVSAPKTEQLEAVDPRGPYEDISNNQIRKVIAKRLAESKRDIPHFYTSVDVELDEVLKMRKKLKSQYEINVSVNDLIIKASALALKDVPAVNGSNDNNIDISVAVATPTGLITPIVTNAVGRGVTDINKAVKDLATRARENKLKPEEFQGGTFTISNLGMFGIDEFSAVINPPQKAILAVGGGTPTLVSNGEGGAMTRTIMTARLSADFREVDECTAAQFLQVLKLYLSKPDLMIT